MIFLAKLCLFMLALGFVVLMLDSISIGIRRYVSTPYNTGKLKRPVKIYVLLGPDGRPFYAGRTNRTLEQRLKEHIAEASPNGGPKQRYIYDILEKGKVPTIKLIETIKTNESDVQNAERRAIMKYGLTNIKMP